MTVPVLLNSFEGGTSTTAITTGISGGNSGSAFDFVGATGTVNAFSSTYAAHGALSGELATSGSASAYWQWAASFPSVSQAWFRLYGYFTANPVNQHRLWNATASGGSVMSVALTTAGLLAVSYGTSGTAYVTFTDAVNLNAWFRVEGYVIASATVGQVSVSLYNTMDSATATETHTSAANLDTAASNPTSYSFGSSSSVASVGPFWIDDIGLSASGYLGPATAPSSYIASMSSM